MGAINRKNKELYFIVGTSTGIGKTYVTSKLVEEEQKKGKKVMVLKPIETGSALFNEKLEGSDSRSYADLLKKKIEEINIYFFKKPMSPHIASDLDGEIISVNKIRKRIDEELEKNDALYVEGAGGLLVPYRLDYTYLDLLKEYKKKSKVIVVINNSLGAINHTLLTINVLKSNDIKIEGLIFNNRDNITDKLLLENNIETIEKISGIEVLKNFAYKEMKIRN